ncbi:RNA polymerase sigma factor [Streptomyces sp. WMMB 322]|uniref:RNA polymerase sigma factor n=1 Tax=Streptomyces sp. WMMB 322 TaxID=1286821 RepID=UPI0020C8117B|nr:sigma-70 family RNA polymerase sigma factor [Streptomyces sp. WMMB 322]
MSGQTGSRMTDQVPLDFSAFHSMSRPAYVRFALRELRCRADAEEAVDETFEQLLLGWTDVLSMRNPAAYAWRVLRNRVIDHARARGRRPSLLESAAFETAAMKEAHDPIGEFEDNWRLFRAMASLPPRRQDVIVMLHLEGYSIAETAARLGITEAGVRSTNRAGKRQLRELLDPEANEEGEC